MNEKIIYNYCEKSKIGTYLLVIGLFSSITLLLLPIKINGYLEILLKIVLFLYFLYLSYFYFSNTYSLLSINNPNLRGESMFNLIFSIILTLVIFIFSITIFLSIIR
jgi:hypothetical protein